MTLLIRLVKLAIAAAVLGGLVSSLHAEEGRRRMMIGAVGGGSGTGVNTASGWEGEGESDLWGWCECFEHQIARYGFAAQEIMAAFDVATGKDLRNFPPDRVVDHKHMKLEMRFEDLNARRFSAVQTLRFAPIGRPASTLMLNAVGLQVESVTLGGKPVEHFAASDHLSIRFPEPLPPDQDREIVIRYTCDSPTDGMTFTPFSPDAPDYHAEVHTQGQPESNRHWFPCHDSPNERLTTELIVDVPAEFAVSSNGRLVSNSTKGGRRVWHYLQDKPHPNYLVSLVIGKFDVVKLDHPRVPMQVWVPPGKGELVEKTYGRTGAMIDLFEERFGVAYPWARYDQLVVKNFGAGGMENTSVTSMYPTAIYNDADLLDGDLDSLIAHELGHQWFGDLMTCKSWQHIWLNEGWATYCSALWFEKRDGEDGYYDSMRRNFNVAQRDRTTNDLPMVSPVYDNPGQTFRRPANPYPKGASILHMLRRMLGEDVFWQGVRQYTRDQSFTEVETSDFRYAMEQVSGLSLEWFFDQWCFRPGAPELSATVNYDGASRELIVEIVQNQQIDARTPAFRFVLPVIVRTAGGESIHEIDVRGKSATLRTTLDGPPTMVAIDPYLHVLKTITVEKPMAWWLEEAQRGPTVASRYAAIEALGRLDSPDHIAFLSNLVNDSSIRHSLRIAAVDTLNGYASSDAKAKLHQHLESGVDDARVRASLIRAVRGDDRAAVLELLATIADSDPSADCRSAAIEGLGRHKATEHADLIVRLADFRSRDEDVRQASLRTLVELDDARGLDLAMKYAAYGNPDRSRSTAVNVASRLAKHDRERTITFLLDLLEDPEPRTIRAAMNALVEVGDRRGLAPLQAMGKSHRNASLRSAADDAAKRLQAKLDGTAPPETASDAAPESRRGRRSE